MGSQCIDSLILRLPHPLQKVIWCICLEQEILNFAIIMFYLPISVPAYSNNSNPSFFPGFELSHLIGYPILGSILFLVARKSSNDTKLPFAVEM